MLIIVEGDTDERFIKAYIEFLKSKDSKSFKKITFYNCGGKDNLKQAKEKIQKAINQDEKIKIIFDADNNLENSKNNIKKQLKNMIFKNEDEQEVKLEEKNYDIFLFPNNKDTGTLENLIENIAEHKEVLKCFECYKKCLEKIQKTLPDNKAKIFAYFKALGKDDRQTQFNNYLDMTSSYLDDLKNFLMDKTKNETL